MTSMKTMRFWYFVAIFSLGLSAGGACVSVMSHMWGWLVWDLVCIGINCWAAAYWGREIAKEALKRQDEGLNDERPL